MKPIRPACQPCCPECGYSLRRHGGRDTPCPECGLLLPFALTKVRRWARLRLPWDRTSRRGLIRPYLASLIWIAFRPAHASAGLGIPDHWGRAVRWAVAHYLLALVIGLALPGITDAVAWFQDGSPDVWRLFLVEDWITPNFTFISNSLLSLPLWAWCIIAAPLISLLFALTSPQGGKAARHARIKWTLYCAAMLPFLIVLCAATVTVLNVARVFLPLNILTHYDAQHAPPILMLVVFALYCLPWSIGHTLSLYVRKRRRWYGTYMCFLAMSYIWFACIVPLGSLERLLYWPYGDW